MIFISHSRQNSGAALRLCDELESRGVKTWLDLRELPSGLGWNEKVAEAVRASAAILFLIGPPGAEDQYQRFEWGQVVEEEFYLDPARTLIPVLIGSAELPGFLKTRHALRVPETGLDFAVLAQQVQQALEKPEETIDRDQLERGRAARLKAQENLSQYVRELEERDIKQAGLRSLK